MTSEPGGAPERRIVVGVDGSASSRSALAWAARQSRLTGAVVEAVTAWEFPSVTGYPVLVSDVDWEDLAEQIVTDAIREVGNSVGQAEIHRKVIEGNAAQVLLAESADAELLVVGRRGQAGFVEALLGSVSQHCVHHAKCPVVVIRGSVTAS